MSQMPKGEGKGWARGRTAATDPRIARAAEGHLGKKQVRRRPLSEMKWVRSTWTTLPIEWSAVMAYVVGLTATDGCLVSGRRAIKLQVRRQTARRDLSSASWPHQHSRNRTYEERRYRLPRAVSDTRLYGWFQHVGLTPRKSLTLGAIDVPDEFLSPLVRGLLDGDGNITNAVWRADTSRRTDYYYEWFRARFASASLRHLEWLKERLVRRLKLRGWIWQDLTRGNGMRWLCYGKHDSIKLLRWLYADPAAACLQRKRSIWDNYVMRHPDWTRDIATTIYK